MLHPSHLAAEPSDAARFAYELCDPNNEPLDAASVAATACDDDPERIWDELSELRGPDCYRIARHPRLPERCQQRLARSGDLDAAAGFIDAAHTPASILERLVKGGHARALGHPNVSEALLRTHAQGPKGHLVACNPAAPADLLYTLARHAEPGLAGRHVARSLATNDATGAVALDELIGKDWDDEWFTASLIASHVNTPPSSIRAALETAPPRGWANAARAAFGVWSTT